MICENERGEILSFQEIEKKHYNEYEAAEEELNHGSGPDRDPKHTRIYAFDLLYLNGESLLRKPILKRKELLHSLINDHLNSKQSE